MFNQKKIREAELYSKKQFYLRRLFYKDHALYIIIGILGIYDCIQADP
jgi:hypothetical protein